MVTDAEVVSELFALAEDALGRGERPFAAVLVHDGRIIARATDEVFATADPTAHAEVVVIRRACAASSTVHLRGHTLYSLVEPCVMCCGAVHWSRVDGVVFAVSQRALQEGTGGTPKPSIRDLLPLGGGPLHVRGPLAQERGLEILGRYDFRARRV